jgi:AraC family L-rhamnose operon regulatory protein RhaS
VFTREFGISPHRYAMQMQVREACQRLRNTTQPVKTIMHDLGFESRTTFLRMFRRVTGMTPAEFRAGTRRML